MKLAVLASRTTQPVLRSMAPGSGGALLTEAGNSEAADKMKNPSGESLVSFLKSSQGKDRFAPDKLQYGISLQHLFCGEISIVSAFIYQ